MCIHRMMYDSDQEYVDAFFTGAADQERSAKNLQTKIGQDDGWGGTIDQEQVDFERNWGVRLRALGNEFRKALANGPLTDGVQASVFKKINTASDNGTLAQLAA